MHLPFLSSKKKIKNVLKTEKFDVLHVMTPFNPLMGQRVVMAASSEALVSQFHMVGGTWLINNGGRLLAMIQRNALKRFQVYLGVSSATQEYARQYFGIDLTISPNAVDIAPFKAGENRDFLRGERATVVFLGRLVERKGAQHLLTATRHLRQHGKLDGVRINICGDGDLRPELEQYVITHGLSENVHFFGFIKEDEKADFLASSDLAVFPSTGGEAFGIVLIEAMATGACVVLGGDNSGYRTVLGERPDQIVNPYDTDTFAATLESFIASREKRKQAIAWQDQTVKQYDIEVVGADVENFYYQALQRKIQRK
jgi:phosphatidylinositol alpha-mannosyltransferase